MEHELPGEDASEDVSGQPLPTGAGLGPVGQEKNKM